MKRLIFDPSATKNRMDIVCFISGSGTNYREIVKAGPDRHYLVFTNRPGCPGLEIARGFQHETIELSHEPFLKGALAKYGPGKVPRNCAERVAFEKEAMRLIENRLGRQPDLICLAGYDQWNSDWLVGNYYPRILNVHPGDTTKGFNGLHWIPAAKAILAGESSLRSTVFLVNKSQDEGPVLVQSAEIDILQSLAQGDSNSDDRVESFKRIIKTVRDNDVVSLSEFKSKLDQGLFQELQALSTYLQESVKVRGDWKIYPLAVHGLIGRGRVAVDNTTIFLDDKPLGEYGVRLGPGD